MKYTIREWEMPTFFADSQKEKAFTVKRNSLGAGESVIKTLHYHNRFEIGICTEGEGECYIADRIYRYSPGCIQIVPPKIPHRPNTDEGVRRSWKWILFDGVKLLSGAGINPAEILPIIQKAQALGGVFTREELGNIANAIDILSECADISDEYTNISQALAVGNFLTLAARYEGEPLTYSNNNASEHRLTEVIDFIAEHLDSPELLSEEALAKRYSMSVSNFRRIFKLHCGISPKSFIIRSRMAYAEYLLRKTDLSVSEISNRVGYGEVSGFNRVFKRFFLLSPRAYREMIETS
ncbi:MAG: AraC family transcriptional regulator [Clostridia bacterium]|nr:AraC family transcriptional regulator [Clostridia bacterium]